MWVALCISTLAALVSAGVAWWQTRNVSQLRKDLEQAHAEMKVIVLQFRSAVADWEQDRKRMASANAALLEANRNAYEQLRLALSAPGVPPHLAGEWLRAVAAAGPATSRDEAGGLSPAAGTTPARREPPK